MQHGVALTLTGTSVAFTLKPFLHRVFQSEVLLISSRNPLLPFQEKYKSIHLSKYLIPVTVMTIMDAILSRYAVPKIVIKNAAHATLPKNTVNIITKEAASTGTVPL